MCNFFPNLINCFLEPLIMRLRVFRRTEKSPFGLIFFSWWKKQSLNKTAFAMLVSQNWNQPNNWTCFSEARIGNFSIITGRIIASQVSCTFNLLYWYVFCFFFQHNVGVCYYMILWTLLCSFQCSGSPSAAPTGETRGKGYSSKGRYWNSRLLHQAQEWLCED